MGHICLKCFSEIKQKTKNKKYCSFDCYNQDKTLILSCHNCSKNYKIPKCKTPKKENFCSVKCYLNFNTEKRFEEKLKKNTIINNECREWIGRNEKGYGRTSYRNKEYLVHRLVWEKENGPIPKGMYICHKCDNPKCVELNHLFLGTSQDNTDDKIKKNRSNPRKGEKVNTSKLKENEVKIIRYLGKIGVHPKKICPFFNTDVSNIRSIIRRKTWKHV